MNKSCNGYLNDSQRILIFYEIDSVQDVINDDSDVGYFPVADSYVCQTDHHIVYSHSYCVPVMYFNVYKPGLRDLLSLSYWAYVQ